MNVRRRLTFYNSPEVKESVNGEVARKSESPEVRSKILIFRKVYFLPDFRSSRLPDLIQLSQSSNFGNAILYFTEITLIKMMSATPAKKLISACIP